MSGQMSRGRSRGMAHHGGFKPAIGSFEFTGENANATGRRNAAQGRLADAARAFLLRVGS